MFDFDHDGDFDLMDLVEADIQYGLFEEDNKRANSYSKKYKEKQQKEIKSFWDIFKL